MFKFKLNRLSLHLKLGFDQLKFFDNIKLCKMYKNMLGFH